MRVRLPPVAPTNRDDGRPWVQGIWGRPVGAEAVLSKLHALYQTMQDEREAYVANVIADLREGNDASLTGVDLVFLSDTITLGVGVEDLKDLGTALLCACTLAQRAMRLALREEPRLVYRGAIAVGSFRLAGPFIVGPAVDEAAELMEVAEGAFVWLTPSAQRAFDYGDFECWDLVPRHPVPVKGGDR